MQIENRKMKIANFDFEKSRLAQWRRVRIGETNLQFAFFTFQFATFFQTLVGRNAATVAFHSGSFLGNLDADAGANAGRSRFYHRARVSHALYPARSFDAQISTDRSSH